MDFLAWEAIQHGSDLPSLDELVGLARQSWRLDALCREHPEISWFPTRGEPTEPAKAVCAACLVHDECAAYAATFSPRDIYGVWAGSSGRERRRTRWPNAA